MKKLYIQPSLRNELIVFADYLAAPVLPVSGEASSETPMDSKQRDADIEEEDEAMIMLMQDVENGNTGNLW